MEDFGRYDLILVNECIERVGGKKSIVARLLGSFLSKTWESEVVEAIVQKDIDAAFMAAHTLKGVASNLSLVRLTKCAEFLEALFRAAKDDRNAAVFDMVDIGIVKKIYSDTIKRVNELIPALRA